MNNKISKQYTTDGIVTYSDVKAFVDLDTREYSAEQAGTMEDCIPWLEKSNKDRSDIYTPLRSVSKETGKVVGGPVGYINCMPLTAEASKLIEAKQLSDMGIGVEHMGKYQDGKVLDCIFLSINIDSSLRANISGDNTAKKALMIGWADKMVNKLSKSGAVPGKLYGEGVSKAGNAILTSWGAEHLGKANCGGELMRTPVLQALVQTYKKSDMEIPEALQQLCTKFNQQHLLTDVTEANVIPELRNLINTSKSTG